MLTCFQKYEYIFSRFYHEVELRRRVNPSRNNITIYYPQPFRSRTVHTSQVNAMYSDTISEEPQIFNSSKFLFFFTESRRI